jgi:hypothetical protein
LGHEVRGARLFGAALALAVGAALVLGEGRAEALAAALAIASGGGGSIEGGRLEQPMTASAAKQR